MKLYENKNGNNIRTKDDEEQKNRVGMREQEKRAI